MKCIRTFTKKGLDVVTERIVAITTGENGERWSRYKNN